MLTLFETPIHFGVILLLCIVFLLFTLIGILGVLRSEPSSSGDFAGFMSVLFGFLAFMVLTASVYLLPAAATATELFPYYITIYSFVGLHAFCLVFYFIRMPFWKKQKWAAYLPILGTLSWMTLLWFLATPTTIGVVSDGFINYLVMPLEILLYSGVLVVVYMFIVPTWAVLRLVKDREGSKKTWTWIGWFGFLLWFIAVLLMAMVQFTAAYMIYIMLLASLAWIIIFLSWYQTTQRS